MREPKRKLMQPPEVEITEAADFSYDGYQVVRGEFFAHLFEPSVTLSREKVSVNTACIRKLPEVEFVQFLVNPTEKKLAVKPCEEDVKDSFRWTSGEGKKRKPKHISCRIFFAKIMNLIRYRTDQRTIHKCHRQNPCRVIFQKSDLLFCRMTYKIFRTQTFIFAYLKSASKSHDYCVSKEKRPSFRKALPDTRSGVRNDNRRRKAHRKGVLQRLFPECTQKCTQGLRI